MLFAPLVLGFAGAVLAQDIDLDAVAAMTSDLVMTGAPLAPTVTAAVPTYNPSSAASDAADSADVAMFTTAPDSDDDSSMPKRRALRFRRDVAPDACSTRKVQPVGYGPVASPDTPANFQSNPQVHSAPRTLVAPSGFSTVFRDLNGSTQQSGYMGYYLLKAYDPSQCAAKCNKAAGCVSFNLYYERDPTVDPSADCTPASTTNIVCSLYGLPVSAATAKNRGQYRAKFQVLIEGSNGYNTNNGPDEIANYTISAKYPAAINSVIVNGDDSYIRAVSFPGPYNPSQCTALCDKQANYALAHPNSDGDVGKVCTYVNAYVLQSETKGPLGTYCGLYTHPWNATYATNFGTKDTDGTPLSVQMSYGFSR